jgi:hexosaminidase
LRSVLLFAAVALLSILSTAQLPSLMPQPANLKPGSGQLVINQFFTVAITGHKEPRLERTVQIFLADLRKQTGMLPLDVSVVTMPTASLTIHCIAGTKEVQELGEDESYRLEIDSSGAKLDAQTTLGIIRGLQTFLQLVQTGSTGFVVPAVSIQDAPRFPWRGLMIDVSRHFMPVEVLKRNLDGMAAVKMNVLHWHLSDNQGFRVESKKFPKLYELGSDKLFYTQDEIRDVIAYARERGIRVVPEFDMPGHATAWFVGYPELASGPGPYQIERHWGIFDPAMDPTRESTYKFLDEFIGEMAKLFPDQFFHIGGDEVNGKEWDANPKIREFKRAHSLSSNEDLQAYFNKHVQTIIAKHGKTMLGWDEILRPELPKDIVIQSWRGPESLAQAAKQGYRGLLSHGYYLDLMWSTQRHYLNEPISGDATTLTPEQQKLILGGEACMWAEFVSPENIDSRIWPRNAVIAERLWSPQNVTDVQSMYQRMEVIGHRLDWLGLTHNSGYAPMLRRIAGTDDISATQTLADAVEPVKDYSREKLAVEPPTSATPLDRLIDAARPESEILRKFTSNVDDFLGGNRNPGFEAEIRRQLSIWHTNHAALQPLFGNSFLLQEVQAVSQNLSRISAAGLAALEYIDQGQSAPTDWLNQQLALLADAQKPQAQLLLVVAPAIEKLIRAASPQK